tara:strand:- start:242 stop:496 length:255 start_codon:yes stop_codon:yes gene_type:complete
MKWLMVVLFATMQGDIYVFTNPKFDSREECIAAAMNPEEQKKYVRKLIIEYGKVMPIHGINCLQQDEIKRLIEDAGNPPSETAT